MLEASINKALNKVRDALIEDQRRKNMGASGKSAASLKIIGANLLGDKSWRFQMYGRKPSAKMPPVEEILDWVINKGIKPTPRENKDGSFSKVTQEGLAWAIATKIRNKGTDIHLGKRPGINIEDRVQEILKEFQQDVSKEIRATIINQIKK
jgi:hypothetical protein